MKIALIISTYNKPAELWLTLLSVIKQSHLPDEIIIADDGSKSDTIECIDRFSKQFGVEIQHIWHPDDGFKLATIRNKAIAAAKSDYIIQIDGDLILHSEFIADHKKFAKKGVFISGKRCNINDGYSQHLVATQSIQLPNMLSKHVSKKYNGIRISLLARLFYILPQSKNGYFYVLGCNMAFWKSDLMRVNGYNQDFEGWGKEDNDISIRLINAGVRLRFVKFSAIVFHLFHPENTRSNFKNNEALFKDSILNGATRILNGINTHQEFT
jgi:glycosyltransferase involved in cell wall biosynthesis